MKALLFAVLLAPSTVSQAAAQPLRLVLHWLPQAQFAGYLMAEEKDDITMLAVRYLEPAPK